MNRSDMYHCNVCGRTAYMVEVGSGPLICCGQEMSALKGGEVEASTEKHIPVITKTEHGYHVAIGSVPHPMTAEHYISFIELIVDGTSHFAHLLQSSQTPEATFNVPHGKQVTAKEYCNLHGLWQSSL